MKYVGIDVSHAGMTRRMIIAFPNDFVHLLVGKAVKTVCEEQWPKSKVTIVTAGDIELSVESTSGRSVSLGLVADHADAVLLEASDYSLHMR